MTVVESGTRPQFKLHKHHTALSFHQVREVGQQLGLRFAGTGTHPVADYRDRLVSTGPRYHELLDRNQWIIRRMAVYGLHIHIGMRNGDECIRFNNFFMRFMFKFSYYM